MGIQYAGGNVNVTAACAVKNDILNMLETNLTAAPGWSVVSGSGTTNRLFQTQTTPQGLALRMRAKDNGGTCIQISIESTDGTKVGTNGTGAGSSLIPGFTYRLIACKYQMVLYVPSNYGASRMFSLVSCPFIPSPNAVPARAGVNLADTQSDSNATQFPSFRTSLLSAIVGGGNSTGNQQLLWGASIWEVANTAVGNNNMPSLCNLVALTSVMGSGGNQGGLGNACLRRWNSGADLTYDPMLAWGPTVLGDEPTMNGQLWDCIVLGNNFAGDTPMAYDGHNWLNPTNNAVGAVVSLVNGPRGAMFFVVP